MADRDRFIADCAQCQPNTVGWLIAKLVSKASKQWENSPGLATIELETNLAFWLGMSWEDLEIEDIGEAEDGSISIQLERTQP